MSYARIKNARMIYENVPKKPIFTHKTALSAVFILSEYEWSDAHFSQSSKNFSDRSSERSSESVYNILSVRMRAQNIFSKYLLFPSAKSIHFIN